MMPPIMLVWRRTNKPIVQAGPSLARYGIKPSRFLAAEVCGCDLFAAVAACPVVLPLLIANWISRCSGTGLRSENARTSGLGIDSAWYLDSSGRRWGACAYPRRLLA